MFILSCRVAFLLDIVTMISGSAKRRQWTFSTPNTQRNWETLCEENILENNRYWSQAEFPSTFFVLLWCLDRIQVSFIYIRYIYLYLYSTEVGILLYVGSGHWHVLASYWFYILTAAFRLRMLSDYMKLIWEHVIQLFCFYLKTLAIFVYFVWNNCSFM